MNDKINFGTKQDNPSGLPPSRPPFGEPAKKRVKPTPMELTHMHTDVLVIGGGFAGNFAAINAVEAGAKVLMAVKGRTGRSGLTPWANSWFVFEGTQGATRKDYLEQFIVSGEYLNNMDFVDILMDEAYARYEDVSAWGARTGRENYYQPGTVTRSIEVVGSGDAMRAKAVASGVQLLERIMITTLIKQDKRVVGALGFHMESGRPYAIHAKATVMCAGPASFKPLGMGFPCSSATGDGDAMAYRVGAEISGKEFNDGHPARKSNPLAETETRRGHFRELFDVGGGPPGDVKPVEKINGKYIGMRITAAYYGADDGGLPIDPAYTLPPGSTPEDERKGPPPGGPPGGPPPGGPDFAGSFSGFSTIGMSNHKAEGVFPQDLNGASNVPGLWAAGDGLSSMQNGAGYAGFGCSCAGSAVQGARAGLAAAEFAKNTPAPQINPSLLDSLKQDMLDPIVREKGYSPAWVTRMMQNIMFPYFVLYVKEKSRMETALNQIMYIQTKFAPQLAADDFHELRLAHETRNMLLNAEMKLRAGLAREESRGTHFREDFPYRDDENWLAWVKLVQKDGEMVAVKHPIPVEWHPEESLSYRDKYPAPYPGEDEFLEKR